MKTHRINENVFAFQTERHYDQYGQVIIVQVEDGYILFNDVSRHINGRITEPAWIRQELDVDRMAFHVLSAYDNDDYQHSWGGYQIRAELEQYMDGAREVVGLNSQSTIREMQSIVNVRQMIGEAVARVRITSVISTDTEDAWNTANIAEAKTTIHALGDIIHNATRAIERINEKMLK